MSGMNGCALKQAVPTPLPTPANECQSPTSPHDTFILFSPDVPLIQQTFYFEGDVRYAAERIARSHRGARVTYAKVIATVVEPLPALEWSDGQRAGSGQEGGGIMSLDELEKRCEQRP